MIQHEGQVRKYTGKPYIIHPSGVSWLVTSCATADDEMVAAAWLHDTMEDCGETFVSLQDQFGTDVATLVRELTDLSRPEDGNRATRKAIDRERLLRMRNRAKTIKVADIIDNIRSIVRDDVEFAKVYLPEKMLDLEVLVGADPDLLRRAWFVMVGQQHALRWAL